MKDKTLMGKAEGFWERFQMKKKKRGTFEERAERFRDMFEAVAHDIPPSLPVSMVAAMFEGTLGERDAAEWRDLPSAIKYAVVMGE